MSRAPIHPLMLSSCFSESASQRSIAVAFRFLPAASLFAARACWCLTSVLLLVVSWRCVDMDWDGTEMGYEMLLFALLSFSCPHTSDLKTDWEGLGFGHRRENRKEGSIMYIKSAPCIISHHSLLARGITSYDINK